ncbi:hypothetical protein ACFY2Q_17275 [Micromonospora sp. NPDC000316]|uniref:hypothetical protein n=1 Tax=Micromonospora sp. NPDC000316 TaxID=3364216 RepID=UPI0036782DDC
MNDLVRATFLSTVASMRDEVQRMPLDRWNESVFRYSFCRHLSHASPDVRQFVECNRIDLVLHRGEEKAFVEFKFYLHQPRFNPYTGDRSGFKGGPSPQNLTEFRKCVDRLHDRQSTHGLSKYVVLVYADPVSAAGTGKAYSVHYDDYRHPRGEVSLELLEATGPDCSAENRLMASLFTVH